MPKTSAPDELGGLGGGDPHASGRGLDEDPLALAQTAVADKTAVGGRVVDGHGRALLEAPAFRQGDDSPRVGDRDLGVPAEPRPCDDTITRGEAAVDPLADRLDLAGHLVLHEGRKLRGVGIESDAREDVGEVDPAA